MSIWQFLSKDPNVLPAFVDQFVAATGTVPSAAERISPERLAEIRAEIRDDERRDEALRRWRGDDYELDGDDE